MELTDALAAKLDACPTSPGVYLMKDAAGHVIYVGKAKNLRSRVRSYFQKSQDHSAKTVHLVSQVQDVEFLRAGTEVEALLLENNLIKKWKPKYNIRLKDDKTYPYVRVDHRHPYPRPYVARKQVHGDGQAYYGPYPNGYALRQTLSLGAKAFLLRDCRDHEFANRSRPCLSFEIGQCTAPCVGKVTKEQYAQQVSDFEAFLSGSSTKLEESWEREMEAASESMEFEKAARLRDRLQMIRQVTEQEQRMVDTVDNTDRDIWAVWPPLEESEARSLDVLIVQFRGGLWVGRVHRTADLGERLPGEEPLPNLILQHYTKNALPAQVLLPDGATSDAAGLAEALRVIQEVETPPDVRFVSEKAEWGRVWELALENVKGMHADQEAVKMRTENGLEAIARLLELPQAPRRLECVDISNLQGEANVASAVVFRDGKPDTGEYRHYKIAGFDGQNDFASMREVMSRRYGKTDSPVPDLLVVDGGKGQLASALEILKSLGCTFPIVGLAKARTKRDFQSGDLEGSEERLFLPGQKNPKPIRHAEAFRILTHLRDEAHRFAITFHRSKRDKARFTPEDEK